MSKTHSTHKKKIKILIWSYSNKCSNKKDVTFFFDGKKAVFPTQTMNSEKLMTHIAELLSLCDELRKNSSSPCEIEIIEQKFKKLVKSTIPLFVEQEAIHTSLQMDAMHKDKIQSYIRSLQHGRKQCEKQLNFFKLRQFFEKNNFADPNDPSQSIMSMFQEIVHDTKTKFTQERKFENAQEWCQMLQQCDSDITRMKQVMFCMCQLQNPPIHAWCHKDAMSCVQTFLLAPYQLVMIRLLNRYYKPTWCVNQIKKLLSGLTLEDDKMDALHLMVTSRTKKKHVAPLFIYGGNVVHLLSLFTENTFRLEVLSLLCRNAKMDWNFTEIVGVLKQCPTRQYKLEMVKTICKKCRIKIDVQGWCNIIRLFDASCRFQVLEWLSRGCYDSFPMAELTSIMELFPCAQEKLRVLSLIHNAKQITLDDSWQMMFFWCDSGRFLQSVLRVLLPKSLHKTRMPVIMRQHIVSLQKKSVRARTRAGHSSLRLRWKH